MQTKLSIALVFALSTGLTGCTGGNTTVPPEEPTTTRETFSTTAQNVVRNFASDTAVLGAPQDVDVIFEYVEDSDEVTVTLTVFGRTVVFTEADLNEQGFEFAKQLDGSQQEAYLWLVTDTVADIPNGTTRFEYLVMFGTSDFDAASEDNNRAFGVFGYETAAADLPSGGVTYSGPIYGESLLASGDEARVYLLDGEFSFDVDFGSGNVTNGQLYNLTLDQNPIDDAYNLVDTPLSGSAFSTTVVADTTGCEVSCASVASSLVQGAFYGPSGSETGGNFTISGTNTAGQEYVAHGAFGGTPSTP